MHIFFYFVFSVLVGSHAFEQQNIQETILDSSKQSDENFHKNNDNVVSEKETIDYAKSDDYATEKTLHDTEIILHNTDNILQDTENILQHTENILQDTENIFNDKVFNEDNSPNSKETPKKKIDNEEQKITTAFSQNPKVTNNEHSAQVGNQNSIKNDQKPDGETVFTNKDLQEKIKVINDKIKTLDKSFTENEETDNKLILKQDEHSENKDLKNDNPKLEPLKESISTVNHGAGISKSNDHIMNNQNFKPTTDNLNDHITEHVDDVTSSIENEKSIPVTVDTDTESIVKNEDHSSHSNTENSESNLSTKKENVDDVQKLYEEAVHLLSQEKKDHKRAFNLLLNAADQNHTLSMEKVVYDLIFGDILERNLTKAVEMFHMLATKGSPVGQQGLGFVYGIGLTVPSSQAKMLIYSTFSALGGDVYSQMMLGYRSYMGIGVTKSCESALTYYKKVAESVSNNTSSHGGIAVQRVRLYDELEQPGGVTGQIDEDLLQYYHFLADKGDLQAQVGLGQLYFQGGRGIEVSYEKAFKYFQLAANAGNGNGLAYLGKMYLEGLHVPKDVTKALEYFKKSTEQANPIGQAGMGMLYLTGEGVPKDYQEAIKYFSQAAEQGWVEGQLQLGNMYFNGLGVKQDYKQAIKYFTYASQSGHVLAFYNLAQMHASGAGGIRSCNTAVELFKNVAERGKWSTMFMDAYDAYKSGDVDTALLKYYFLAELGYEVAQSNVAYILDKDNIEMFDKNQTYVRALLQWSRAAQQGYAVARVKVGDYHYYGLGTKVDYEAAAQHYKLASDQQNNPQAMFNLGYMHEQGLGLKQDMHLAKRFYDMAALASPDAQIPVYLALCKLTVIFTWENIQLKYNMLKGVDFTAEFNRILVATVQMLGSDWDVYLITILVGLLAAIVLFRRAYFH
ncbi:protein sel-1 homolog 1 isoform X2 [Hydra vulgaris]|uniref:Protein sel-1 homolog 1 isoform X2 n=1 Tax=Hydra vulgaris TaxID=6087 RepID=A0ABM4CGC8_HYDVU